jgi:hypothetical protein
MFSVCICSQCSSEDSSEKLVEHDSFMRRRRLINRVSLSWWMQVWYSSCSFYWCICASCYFLHLLCTVHHSCSNESSLWRVCISALMINYPIPVHSMTLGIWMTEMSTRTLCWVNIFQFWIHICSSGICEKGTEVDRILMDKNPIQSYNLNK